MVLLVIPLVIDHVDESINNIYHDNAALWFLFPKVFEDMLYILIMQAD